jgi:hypothetical protein
VVDFKICHSRPFSCPSQFISHNCLATWRCRTLADEKTSLICKQSCLIINILWIYLWMVSLVDPTALISSHYRRMTFGDDDMFTSTPIRWNFVWIGRLGLNRSYEKRTWSRVMTAATPYSLTNFPVWLHKFSSANME